MKDTGFRVIAGLILLAAIVGIGLFAYNAGVTHAAVVAAAPPIGPAAVQPYPYYGYGMGFWHPMPFLGFGCLGLLLPLFLLFVAFGAFRRMLWGPRWGWHHMHHHGWAGAEGEGGVPQMFSEWHRRAHGETDPEKRA